MVGYGNHLAIAANQLPQWADNFINYEALKQLVEECKHNKLNAEGRFLMLLSEEYEKYLAFINEFVNDYRDKVIGNSEIGDILQMNKFVHDNQEALRKIVKKHDKNSTVNLSITWNSKISDIPYDHLFVLLHKASKQKFDARASPTAPKVYSNETFVRKSKKFWVQSNNIIPLISHIIGHMPLYVYHDEETGAMAPLDQEITSIYFDNSNFDVYADRIQKVDGSRLIRIRAYDNDFDSVYFERKIHRESWTGEESSKDRFKIDGDKVMNYLNGEYIKDTPLGFEIQKCVNEKKLRPCIRTNYRRLAFQLPSDNSVRLSLDIDLNFVKETVSDSEWMTPFSNLRESDLNKFPFAVLEVKLQGDNVENPPPWVAEIMNGPLTIEEPFFSKFGHGTFAFHQDIIRQIPDWVNRNKTLFVAEQHLESMNETKPLLQYVGSKMETVSRAPKSSVDGQHTGSHERSMLDIFTSFVVHGGTPRVTSPMKVEPKTHFANERTFLQWFNSAVLLCSVGMALAGLGIQETRVSGIFLCVTGFITLGYSCWTYKRRMWILKYKVSDVPIHDAYGPLVLCFCVVGAVILSLAYL